MKLSLITATFNSEASINSTLDSISLQDFTDLELLVIDGNSQDNTLSIIKESYKGEVKIVSEEDRGIYDALNKGIKIASGEIIGIVHSDDFLANTKILSKIAQIFEDPKVDGVYGDLQYVNKENAFNIIRYWKSEKFKSELLNYGWMPAHPTLFLRRKVYEKHGLFSLDFKIAADYDFILRIFKDNTLNFEYLPQVITKMQLGGASNRNIKNIIQKSIEDYKALKKNNIRWPIKVLIFKNLSKLSQFTKN